MADSSEPFDAAAAEFVARFAKQIDEATTELIAETRAASAELREHNQAIMELLRGDSGPEPTAIVQPAASAPG